ncbi:hypothetical protein [Clostridium estertheticum]|uniref:hypothetical protein n=1 Tax=Clostridium estertheticum TaxID=238834 RepID=UPI001C0D0781|nr:hypothetical protein [Clostridium estertheticum]MBU3174606.1 hypothetical protein [Clostridium estertheticum]
MNDSLLDIDSNQTLATSKEANLIIKFFTGVENDDDAQQMLIDIQAHYDKKGTYLEIDAVVFWHYLLNRKPYQQSIKKSKQIRYYDFKKIMKIKGIDNYNQLVEAAKDYNNKYKYKYIYY